MPDQDTDSGKSVVVRDHASAGEITMWGIRAIRVAVLLAGLLSLTATSGCCDCCKNLWKSEKPPAASQTGQTSANTTDEKDAEKVLANWKRSPADWGFKDQTHLTPERIKGGIY